MDEKQRFARIQELILELKRIEQSCQSYKPIGPNGSKSDYNACLAFKDHHSKKKELNELLQSDD